MALVRNTIVSESVGHASIPDMAPVKGSDLKPYLARLRALPFVKGITLYPLEQGSARNEDARLTIRTATHRYDLAVELKGTPLSQSVARSFLAHVRRNSAMQWVIFSPYVSRPVSHLLVTQSVGFVDQAGNCHLALGEDHLAHVEGRSPGVRPRLGRGLGARSYQVIFTLLARPELVTAPIRTLAEAAGVRKTAVADLLRRLSDEGLILRGKGSPRIIRPGTLLDRWVAGYADKLRPHLLVGRYQPALKEPSALARQVEAVLRRSDWAWGGATAAYKLTQHYRSSNMTLHVRSQSTDHLQRQLRLLPATNGPLTLLGVPGPLALKGPALHFANPLLVYTELLLEGDERAVEAASEIRARFLGYLT